MCEIIMFVKFIFWCIYYLTVVIILQSSNTKSTQWSSTDCAWLSKSTGARMYRSTNEGSMDV